MNKPKHKQQNLMYNEDSPRIEFWSDDDINELKEELNVNFKQSTTDFRDTHNIWNSDDY